MIERVIVYIDGFNLYYGIRQKRWNQYLWLDVHLFAQNLLLKSQRLEKVRYFTSFIFDNPNDPDKAQRQKNFLKATRLKPDVCIYYGAHRKRKIFCTKCNSSFQKPEEKMTDVNIAVKLLEDAQDNLFDTAFLVCGDVDLSGAVESVTRRYANKKVVVYCPPGRRAKSSKLQMAASHYRSVKRSVLAKSQLPDKIAMPNNQHLCRPPSWK